MAVMLTIFFAFGIIYLRIETDFQKELPQDNPAILLNNRVSDTFSGQDTMFVVVSLDPASKSKNAVRDIRDPRVISMLTALESEFADKSGVDKSQSVASVFRKGQMPSTLDQVKLRLEKVPGSSGFFNRDYSSTIVSVFANVGSSPGKVAALNQDIRDSINEVPKPPGLKLSITGMPPVRVRIGQILVSDANYTTLLSSVLILALLLVMTKPFTRGFLIFAPLVMALIWTIGTMGWLGIPLSMVTVGVGAMIMGLGVEYGAFYVSVYEDAREKGQSQNHALFIAQKEVGSAIFGSASTTVAGFLALLFASMPLMHHLGFALALGITYCFITALYFNPALIVTEEKYSAILFRKFCRIAGVSGVGK
jgi:hydrophobe/amphiphile efflux-3 (HAE3) family protein